MEFDQLALEELVLGLRRNLSAPDRRLQRESLILLYLSRLTFSIGDFVRETFEAILLPKWLELLDGWRRCLGLFYLNDDLLGLTSLGDKLLEAAEYVDSEHLNVDAEHRSLHCVKDRINELELVVLSRPSLTSRCVHVCGALQEAHAVQV